MQELEEFQRAGQTKLMSMRNPDGGWAWFCASGHRQSDNSDPYWTMRVLLALHEIRRSGVPVNDATLRAGLDFLLAARNSQGRYSPQEIFFCPAAGEDVDMVFTADLFSSIVEMARELDGPYRDRLSGLCEQMAGYLQGKPRDPLGVARAAHGLWLYSQWQKDEKYLAVVQNAVDHLFELRQGGRWQGIGYRADTLVNAAIAEFLYHFAPHRYTGELHDVVTWLVSEQTAWGGWGTTLDTAMAIRALLEITSGVEMEQAGVEVKVNDKAVATVAIDPKDPFFSAISLRNLEITPYLTVGENRLEVLYNGKLKAPALLETRQWTGHPHLDRALSLKRTAPTEARVGDLIPVTLEISTTRPSACLVVEERLPANFTIEERSLRELIDQRAIAEYKWDKDKVFFYLHRVEKDATIRFYLIAVGEGKIRHPGTSVVEMYDESVQAACTGGDIVIAGGN